MIVHCSNICISMGYRLMSQDSGRHQSITSIIPIFDTKPGEFKILPCRAGRRSNNKSKRIILCASVQLGVIRQTRSNCRCNGSVDKILYQFISMASYLC